MKQKSDHEIDSVLDMKNKSIFFLILAKFIVEIFRQCQWRVKFKKNLFASFRSINKNSIKFGDRKWEKRKERIAHLKFKWFPKCL
jgi:hypothetical protein